MATPRELALWARFWTYPQAVMWEQLNQVDEVAWYTRIYVRAESPRSSAIILGQLKQYGESLGLSVSGMQRNRWTIAAVDADDQQSAPQANAQVTSLAERLRAVSGD
jgi:hypothetical protein